MCCSFTYWQCYLRYKEYAIAVAYRQQIIPMGCLIYRPYNYFNVYNRHSIIINVGISHPVYLPMLEFHIQYIYQCWSCNIYIFISTLDFSSTVCVSDGVSIFDKSNFIYKPFYLTMLLPSKYTYFTYIYFCVICVVVLM